MKDRDLIRESGGGNLYAIVTNNLIDWIDKLGFNIFGSIMNFEGGNLRFHMYKKFGGPGWANGTWVNDGWLKEDIVLIESADKLDTCFKEHDICYENCRKVKCPYNIFECFKNCDAKAVNCQLTVLLAPFVQGEFSLSGIISAPIGMVILKLQQIKNTLLATLIATVEML